MLLKKALVFSCMLAYFALSAMYVEAAGKPVIAVIPFSDQSARKTVSHQEALDNAWDYVDIALKHTGRFSVMTRTQIERLVDEIQFDQESGMVDPSTAARWGKMIGAKYLVLGTVTSLSRKGSDIVAGLSLRMIEVETAEIYLSGRGRGKSKEDEVDALERATKEALNGEMGMLTMLRGGK